MDWTIGYVPEAQEDILRPDRSQQLQGLKAIEKVYKILCQT